MAITVDSADSGAFSSSATSINWSHTTGSLSNGILVVRLGYGNAGAPTISVKLGTTDLTKFSEFNQGSGSNAHIAIWYLLAPPAGTATITVEITANAQMVAQGTTYSGADQSTIFRTVATSGAVVGSPFNATASITVTSSLASDLGIDAIISDESSGGATNTVVGSQVQEFNIESNAGGKITSGSRLAGTGSNLSMSWTLTLTDYYAYMGVAMIAAAGGAGVPSSGRILEFGALGWNLPIGNI